MVIISPTWAPYYKRIEWNFEDPSGTGVCGRLTMQKGCTIITVIGAYVPPKQSKPGPYTLNTRLHAFLDRERHQSKTPVRYMKDNITKWILDAKLIGHHTFLVGDLNGSIVAGSKRGHNFSNLLHDLDLIAPFPVLYLPHFQDAATFFWKDAPVSNIDHIMFSHQVTP
jgi:hypothetical protein